ncbi:hypothetical protein LTR78_006452 [Recurvomyces mirabilis]|uniref:Uncharacterized protein n=1 Tax=Recurvomyces mirabilis TaxID=574656 RepID=A0AAE0WKU1_9PEZI|nr:hypothetical protein LTR78_006452 [Recurvomyces mirabilis]KAK5151128.1 hypothetical protein LTS14_009624 [Recurvomyces mirabilis]
MGGMTNWNDVETRQRVVASIVATGVKINLSEAAKYYGTTYNTFENKFRHIKKQANELKAAADNGETGDVPTPTRTKSVPSTPRKPKTPRKDPLSSVSNGRVTKPSPSKNNVKKEPNDSLSSSFLQGLEELPIGSFDESSFDIEHASFDFEGMEDFQ